MRRWRSGASPRIPSNDNLERDIAELVPRPVGRPSKKPLVEYKGFLYQAAGWKTARRVVAKVEHHLGELYPRVRFIVTNLTFPSQAVVRFYNKRGTAEQWIKEGKQAVKMTRLLSPVPVERGPAVADQPITWATFGGGWHCRKESGTGP